MAIKKIVAKFINELRANLKVKNINIIVTEAMSRSPSKCRIRSKDGC